MAKNVVISKKSKKKSMRVKIIVEIWGSHTLFDEVLEGPIPADDHLTKALASLTDGIKSGQQEVSA
jgi:hypothetical protein